MSPLYDLILQRKGELQTETVQVVDAAQAWRLGRDGSAAEPSKRRLEKGIRIAWDGAAA